MTKLIKEVWIYTINGMSNDCGKCCAGCDDAVECELNCCNQNKFDCDNCSYDF